MIIFLEVGVKRPGSLGPKGPLRRTQTTLDRLSPPPFFLLLSSPLFVFGQDWTVRFFVPSFPPLSFRLERHFLFPFDMVPKPSALSGPFLFFILWPLAKRPPQIPPETIQKMIFGQISSPHKPIPRFLLVNLLFCFHLMFLFVSLP